jgi:hypothetical protein
MHSRRYTLHRQRANHGRERVISLPGNAIQPTLPIYDGNLPKIVSVAEVIVDKSRGDFASLCCK